MNENEYLNASQQFVAGGDMHEDKVPPGEMDYMMHAAKVTADWCDTVKRGLFYGTDVKLRTSHATTTSLTYKPELKDLIHGIIGAFGEAGEMLDHLHDVLTGRAELDQVNLLEEIGDLEWYLACIHRFIGSTPSQAWDTNIAKLDKRYPGRRFTQEAAENRNLAAERAVLEGSAATVESRPEPEAGSQWTHRNGATYTVMGLANLHDNPRYPRTVIYQGANGQVWTRRADDWHRSMTEIGVEKEQSISQTQAPGEG